MTKEELISILIFLSIVSSFVLGLMMGRM